jgi:alanine dehydrogenase
MPDKFAQISTFALNNTTLPYTLKFANQGSEKALSSNSGFLKGLNIHEGKVTYEAVAEAVGMNYTPREDML